MKGTPTGIPTGLYCERCKTDVIESVVKVTDKEGTFDIEERSCPCTRALDLLQDSFAASEFVRINWKGMVS